MISAGAAGIGRVIVETFLAHDYHVHICDIGAEAIAELLSNNAGASATIADLSNVAQAYVVSDNLAGEMGADDCCRSAVFGR